MCEKFHCLPSALLDEDVELVRLLLVEQLGRNRAERERQQAEEQAANY